MQYWDFIEKLSAILGIITFILSFIFGITHINELKIAVTGIINRKNKNEKPWRESRKKIQNQTIANISFSVWITKFFLFITLVTFGCPALGFFAYMGGTTLAWIVEGTFRLFGSTTGDYFFILPILSVLIAVCYGIWLTFEWIILEKDS
ncbi:MAG: hypothetical protein AB7S75_19075 [Desulfococcaceae bacterium]